MTTEQQQQCETLWKFEGFSDFGEYEHPFTGTTFHGGRQDGTAQLLPNYLCPSTGLSHLHRVEGMLTDEQHEKFRDELWWLMQNHRRFVSATAPQRLAALAATLNQP